MYYWAPENILNKFQRELQNLSEIPNDFFQLFRKMCFKILFVDISTLETHINQIKYIAMERVERQINLNIKFYCTHFKRSRRGSRLIQIASI
jgi:hypothetical protein